jgi:uncharacterized protein YjaG (DUF416 family)
VQMFYKPVHESKVRLSQKNMFLLKEWVWIKFNQCEDQKPRLTPNHYSFCKQEGHALTLEYPFIEKDVWNAMIKHFQTKV